MNADALIIAAMLGGSAVFAGAVTYAITGRDLRGWSRAATALGVALLVGAAAVFVLYLSVIAFLACAAAYLVIRRLVRPTLALAASGLVLFGGLSGAAMLMWVALSEM
ncbi:hypothetical protein HUT06_03250 [Actinomadura sp. NAK00032]|uniref:hypothetical protein n=1 Tax=Actinomadura sp. NAK00032 TaxID=2742128 RepID=UPI001592845E|nr:hypothetical protein [Actinomadura sp. NAK00032]QKW33174.1 hypothetical protein HUT06_03250 [Actinomadura sp. NAK00032]